MQSTQPCVQHTETHFFSFYFYLCIYFWLRWVSVAAHQLSLVASSRGYSSLQCMGFSLQWLLLLWSTGSRHAGFSSCGTWAQLLCGMWDLPGPGIEPVFPALAGGFLTTAPPGKSLKHTLKCQLLFGVEYETLYKFKYSRNIFKTALIFITLGRIESPFQSLL